MSRILIVDDRATNREYLTTLLSYGGHRLFEAADGAEALRLVRDERPDLVISDILMPTMDGFEFAKNVRAEPDIANTKIVFYTATYRADEARLLATACGVSAVIAKPADPQRVLDVVNEQLGTAAPQLISQLAIKPVAELAQNLAKLHTTSARLYAMVELGMNLSAERDPQRLLQTFASAARRILGSRSVVALLLHPTEKRKKHAATDGFAPEAADAMDSLALDQGLAAQLLAARKPIRLVADRGEKTVRGLPAGHPAAKSFLGVAIGAGSRCHGFAFCTDKLGGPSEFNEEDEQLAQALAAQLAVIYENFELYDMLQRHAAELHVEVVRREQVQAALAENERGLHRAQLMAKLAHVITGPDGSFERWSETLPQLIGVEPAQLPRTTRAWLDILHPDDRSLFRDKAVKASAEKSRVDLEYRLRKADGEWIHVRQTMEPLKAEGEATSGSQWFNTLRDVTVERLAEIKIRRLNRVYAVLSGINTLIVRVRDRDELFREASRIAIEHGEFRMAWIGVVDKEAGLVKPVASAGDVRDFFESAPLAVIENKPRAHGLAGRAIREMKPVISNDVRNDPQKLMRKQLDERGINSLAVIPLIVSGEAAGVLALYASDVGFFDEQEMRLLLELAGDISFALEHIAKTEKLDYLAYYDKITGLANRTLFHERLSQHVSAASLGESRVAVVMMDVDRFKTINDTLGRQAGDALLKQMAERMTRYSDDPARLARIGADHFAVVVPNVRSEEEFARRVETRMQQFFGEPFRVGDSELRVSVKAGIAIFPDDGSDAETLCTNAEAALKKAKASGDKFLFYTQQMTERVAGKLALENKLRQALENDEFVLHYQPKVNLETGGMVGVEALIRWQSPDKGLVPPLHFIPLLEETGLILPVGSWALKRAARDHRAWTEQGLKPPRVAVNVSAIQLRQRDFVGALEQAIIDGVAPTGIDLEITESLVMEDIKGNIEKLKAVRALGMNIAVDDFGTGYSSLGYLAKLPVQYLKIDRSFIDTMQSDPNAMTLVSTIISLAHSLHLKVIAEGVETEEQAKFLRLLRCDEMQGYLFSKPVPAAAIATMLGGAAPCAEKAAA